MNREVKKEYNQFISPAVKALLKKNSLDISVLSQIQPTGKGGRVTKADILDYISTHIVDKANELVVKSENIEIVKTQDKDPLRGELVALRALEPEDIDLLYKWENDTELWEVSSTQTPFSKAILREYIATSKYDIYTTKQLRLIIEEETHKTAVGMIDLFDFDPYHRRAGVGVFIHKSVQGLGYATEALELLKHYAKTILNMHQLYCNIQPHNKRSLQLFQHRGFEIKAVKQDWLYTSKGWEDELFLQCIL